MRFRSWRLFLALGVLAGAPGCELLPGDGPSVGGMTSQATVKSTGDPTAVTRYALVGIDARVAGDAEQFYKPAEAAVPAAFRGGGGFGLVGVGDLLRVTIWEAGEGLFGGRERKGTDMTVRVDVDGTIGLPFTSRFRVAGRRLAQIEADIKAQLLQKAVDPQVTVLVAENVASTTSIQGDVAKPGPYPLARPNQRILDMIAVAGGSRHPTHETMIRLTRGAATMSAPLQRVIDRPDAYNVAVSAGDTILVTRSVQKFVALGAVAKPGEQTFPAATLNLSEGLGQVLGLDPQRSDTRGVFLFRREPVDLARRYGIQPMADDRDTIPIVYQINLREPQAFFAMAKFPIRPNDILYVSTAPIAELAKFFQVLTGATSTVLIPRTLGGI